MCIRRIKRIAALAPLLGLLLLWGCVHQYLMTLSDGAQVVSLSRPERQGAFYHFTDEMGEAHMVPRSRVVKIRTITPVKETPEESAPAKPKRRKHWYLLWLA